MSGSFLPPTVATLIADTKEYSAKMAEAQGQMDSLGASSDAAGNKFTNFANKASTAVIGVGVAIAAYGIDRAIKYQEALDQIQNTTNATASQMAYLRTEILNLSDQTATSTTDIATAFQSAMQAGYGMAQSVQMVSAAAKVAQITNTDLGTTITTLIGIEGLQLAKGESVAQISDLMVKANKAHVGSLSDLVGILGGKVGAALDLYHVKLSTALAIGDVFSRSNFTNSRAITSMVNALGKMQMPLENTTTSVEHQAATLKKAASTTTTTTLTQSAFALAVEKVGLNAQQLSTAASKPGGLINVLKIIGDQSKATGTNVNTYLNAVFGTMAAGPANLLLQHVGELVTLQTSFGSASSKGLAQSWDTVTKQMSFQLKQIETQLANAFTRIGLVLLPKVEDVVKWGEDLINWFKGHPLVSKIASDAAIGLFTASVAYKIGTGLVSVVKTIGGWFSTSEMTANTGAMEVLSASLDANTAALAGEAGTTGAVAGGAALSGAGLVRPGRGEDRPGGPRYRRSRSGFCRNDRATQQHLWSPGVGDGRHPQLSRRKDPSDGQTRLRRHGLYQGELELPRLPEHDRHSARPCGASSHDQGPGLPRDFYGTNVDKALKLMQQAAPLTTWWINNQTGTLVTNVKESAKLKTELAGFKEYKKVGNAYVKISVHVS